MAVVKLIVIPGNKLDKAGIKGLARPHIEGGRVDVTAKVAGDNLVLVVA